MDIFIPQFNLLDMARNREFDENHVIKTATDLFWERGYHAVSTQDLIDAFGISRSSMYGAYKDKKNLFVLALNHYRKFTSKALKEKLENNSPFKAKIEDILNSVTEESISDSKSKGCYVVNTAVELAPHDMEISDIVQRNRKNITEMFSRAISAAIENGELTKDNNPKALANYFYNLINGLRVDAKFNKEKVDYEDTIKLALSVLYFNKKSII